MKLFKKIFKNYKKLYLIERENNKKLVQQNSKLSSERVNAVKQCKTMFIELEDTRKFLEMEKECSNALRKERTKLKRKITILEKELNK